METNNKNYFKRKNLWSPWGLAFISAFLSRYIALIYLSINYHRLEDRKMRNFVIGLILLHAVVIFIPNEQFITLFIKFSKYFAVGIAGLQNPFYSEHLEYGGEKASLWIPVLISLPFLALTILSLIAASAA